MATSKSSNDDLLKSIFDLVETKSEQKQQRKKRVMTPQAREKAIQNLAAGRLKSLETRRRKKAEKEGGIVPSRPAPEPPTPSFFVTPKEAHRNLHAKEHEPSP